MNAPYALLPILIVVILAYIFTLLLSGLKLISKEKHTYFWNLILLLFFLVSGILGLLAVLKVNYQLSIPHYEELLRLHIHTGIGMVLVAFFHFFRHLKYYYSMFRSGKNQKKVAGHDNQIIDSHNSNIHLLLFLLGFVTFTAQLVLMREFMSLFTGNELVIGFFLSLWLIETGAGALSARSSDSDRFSYPKLKGLTLMISFLPLPILFLLYWLKSNLFPPGTAIGPVEILAGISLLLFPLCFLSGFQFVILTGVASGNRGKNLIADSYVTETIGSLGGGILFSFFLVFLFRSLEVAGIVFSVTAIFMVFTGEKFQRFYTGAAVMSLLFFASVLIFNFDTKLKSLFFSNQEILYNKSHFSGNAIVTSQDGQLNFFSNNNLEFYTGNTMEAEEAAHYAMVQSDNPQRVLIISGDAFAIASEVLKYTTGTIDIVMPSGQYFKLTGKFGKYELQKEKIRTFSGDPIFFLRNLGEITYDVILLNVPPPLTMKDNRFYTAEFFDLLGSHCSSRAVVSLHLPSTFNYAGTEATGLNSVIYNTLKSKFRQVAFIPGEKNHYLAADNPLSLKITEKIAQKGILNEYVNKNYLNDQLLEERSKAFLSTLNPEARINRLLNPGAYLLHLREWLRMHGHVYWIFVAIPALIFFVALFRHSPVRTGLLISGFSASSLQLVIIMGFQLMYGNIFYQAALFFIVFLAGLALGTYRGAKQKKNIDSFNRWQLGLSFLSLLCLFLFILFPKIAIFNHYSFVFHLLNGFIAFSLGMVFSQAAKLETQNITSRISKNYTAELLGSALGTYFASILLIPLAGIINSLVITGSLMLASYLYVRLNRTRYN